MICADADAELVAGVDPLPGVAEADAVCCPGPLPDVVVVTVVAPAGVAVGLAAAAPAEAGPAEAEPVVAGLALADVVAAAAMLSSPPPPQPQGAPAVQGGPPPLPVMAVISQRLWQRRYGSDPAIVGKTIGFGNGRAEIVGVLPADFELLFPPRTGIERAVDRDGRCCDHDERA